MIPIKRGLPLAVFTFTNWAAAAIAMPDANSSATVIQGVNTGSKVRVNNLANLETALNICANTTEILLICAGIYYLKRTIGLDAKTPAKLTWGLVKGLSLVMAGLATPGLINWLIASARDASLCGN